MAAALGLFFFTHCQEGANSSSVESAATTIPDLGGYWVNSTWWQELQSTKSPRKAAEKVGKVAGLIIHQDSTKWLADMSYGWHEGGQLTLRTKDGGLQFYDPQNAAVAQLPVVMQADGSMLLDGEKMINLGDAFTGFNVIAFTLLGGQYDWNGKTVVFNPKGTVVGLEDYYRYELLLDYVVDELGADQLMLSKEGQSPEFFAMKLEGSKLTISEIVDKGGSEDFKYEVGKVKYELVKK